MTITPRNLRELAPEIRALESELKVGGGADKIAKQRRNGKLTARDRIQALQDEGTELLEIGLLLAYDKYAGSAPGVGVVTGIATIEGRPVVVVANDATVKAGAWWPETITKILRAQEIAMRNRLPIVYLVDSAGVNLPLQDGIFPGQYGAARIFYYNSLMRRRLHIPQIAAVMGPCIAGGAYLPALSDIIIMVEGGSFMGLGGPNLVRGAIGQVVDSEALGGAAMHTSISGVAHYRAPDDNACLDLIRKHIANLPALQMAAMPKPVKPPKAAAKTVYDLMPDDHRLPYNMEQVLDCILDGDESIEFQPDYAPELFCATARLDGRPIDVIANRRGFLKTSSGPRVGGIIYTESARKAAYFVEHAERLRLPLLYLQDVSGFMIGLDAETEGIIRAGAEMVEAMACATVPKIVLTLNHASGAGYYAMAGQGFDPTFTFSWPTARIGVMEGDSAVQAIYGPELQRLRDAGEPVSSELAGQIERTKNDYELWLDAKHAAARGHCDAIIDPAETRAILIKAFAAACACTDGDHLPIQFHAPKNLQATFEQR